MRTTRSDQPFTTTRAARSRPAARRFIALFVALFCSAFGTARAEQLECEEVERYRLPNGVDVVLQVDKTLPLVAVVSSVHAGSRNDPAGYAGLAHYVEHLLFREAGPFESVFSLYTAAGATLNAQTTPDTTDYHVTLPSEQLERAVWIEARRLALGLNVLDAAAAEQEKQVLLREQAMRLGYTPELVARRAYNAALFGAGHPYNVLYSTEESIEPLTLDHARWFLATHYRLDQTRLIIVGDFEPAAARALVERHFGVLTPPPAAATSLEPAPVAADECRWAKQALVPTAHRVSMSTRATNESIAFTWPVPAGRDPEQLRPVIGLLASRVADRARELDLSHNIGTSLTRLELSNLWTLGIDVMPGADFDQAEPLVWQALAELSQDVGGSHARTTTKRASELVQRLVRPSLLERALKLTRRACFERECASSNEVTPEKIAAFDKGKAVVLEFIHRVNAPIDGSLEVSP